MTNFTVTPIRTEPNSLVTISVTGAWLLGYAMIRIDAPDNTSYTVGIKLENGSGSQEILLNSGAGQYSFVGISGCEAFVPTSLVVYATCCVPMPNACTLSLNVNRTSYTVGQNFQLLVSHGTPLTDVSVLFNNALLVIKLDEYGIGAVDYTATQAGTLNINAIQYNCVATYILTIMPVNNEVPEELNPPDKCKYPITVVPKFNRPSIPTGTNATLTLTVCNQNSDFLFCTLPELTLPSELSSLSPIKITNERIAANTCRDFNFTVSGLNSTALVKNLDLIIPPNTYTCDGANYQTSISSASVLILPEVQTCGLETLSFLAAPTTVLQGEDVTIRLTLKNIGSGTSSQITLNAVQLPTALSGGTLDFNNVTLAAGETYVYEKIVKAVNNTGADIFAVVQIPTAKITGNCENAIITDDEPHTVTIRINT